MSNSHSVNFASLTHRRPTWAEISLGSLARNYRTLKNHLEGRAQLMAVVKADAYGHGAAECARALGPEADWFGVALVEEGVALRQAGIRRPILCLGGFWTGQADDVIEHQLTPVLFRADAAEELDARAAAAGRRVDFHLKVDTGMGRLGVPAAELADFAPPLRHLRHLRLDGLMTHFAEADAAETGYTNSQIEQYNKALALMRGLGFAPTYQHLCNSAGLHAYPRACGNLARAGAALYGLTRDVLAPAPEAFAVEPVMSLHSRVILLKTVPANSPLGYGRTFVTRRESRIATLPIGYADGLRRAHSNQGRVIVCSRRGSFYAPIVGRVSMDLTLVDVTDAPEVELGDEAILIGERDGLRVTAEDLAEQIGTISYEIVCGISSRVPRTYATSPA